MSDADKLLAACRRKLEAYRDAYGLEYVGGQELSSLLADIDRALAQPAEAVEAMAKSMFERHTADANSAPWGQQWEPTRQYWREKAAATHDAAQGAVELPPLPKATAFLVCRGSEVTARAWNVDELRSYALAAIAMHGGPEPRVLTDLRQWMEHCVSAADEGVDYACPREVLDALTTLGLMEKCGRGKWRPTVAGEKLASGYTHPQAAPAQGDVKCCTWSQEDEGGDWFNVGCGHSYIVNDAETGGMKFCIYCGDPIQFDFWKPDDEDELAAAPAQEPRS